MTEADFRSLKTLVENEFGLSLRNYTKDALTRKILPRLAALKLTSFEEYIDYLTTDGLARSELLNLPSFLMNTESYFLREFAQFELFLELVKQKTGRKRVRADRTIRILSAGCSEGQEPYSISMLLKKQPDYLAGRPIKIYGLDINISALEKAQQGIYSSYSMRAPSIHLIGDFFRKAELGKCRLHTDCFMLSPEIVRSVDFVHANILQPIILKGLAKIDFLFCRNVLMYMSEKASEKIALNLWETLKDDGYLFIGQSESLRKRDDLFEPLTYPEVTVYRKKTIHAVRGMHR